TEMLRRKNLRELSMNFPVRDTELIVPVHQLGDEIKMKAGAAKVRDLLFGCEDDLSVFDRVLEIVFFHGRSYKGRRSTSPSQMAGKSRCDVRGRRSAASLPRPVRKPTRPARPVFAPNANA